MPRAIAVPVRLAMRRAWQQGRSIGELSARFGVPVRTVRHLVRLFRDEETLQPAYDRCGRAAATASPWIEEALRLRQQHAGWGAGLIRVLLHEKYPEAPLPCERTLQRWMRRGRAEPAPPGRRPSGAAQRAQRPHEVWQVDAADQMRLGNGQQASWLRIIDECSGAVLKTVVFPPRELERSAGRRDPARFTASLCPLGPAPAATRRQWRSLGNVE